MAAILDIAGNKRRFVAGMYWRHEDRKPSRRALVDGARKKDWWIVVRRTQNRTYQSGFCPPILNDRGRALTGNKVSLAASVAEVLQEPWLGLFDLGDGRYWYIAVRDNYEILPDGDVIGDYDTVARIREEHASYGEWTVFVDGGLEKIAELVRKSKTAWTIRDIRKRPWMVPLIASGGLILAGAGGGIVWKHHDDVLRARRIAQTQQRLAVLHAMQARESAANVPWLKVPAPGVFLSACASAMDNVPLSAEGWLLDGLSCLATPAPMRVVTTHSPGADLQGAHLLLQARWARAAGATTLQRPQGRILDQGNTIVGTLGAPAALPVDQTGVLLPATDAEALLYGEGQRLGAKVMVSQAAAALGRMPGGKAPAPKATNKPWQGLQVSIQGEGPMLLSAGDLWDRVPGLRLTRLIMQPGKHGATAKLIGELYVRSASLPMLAANPLPRAGLAPGRLAAGRSEIQTNRQSILENTHD